MQYAVYSHKDRPMRANIVLDPDEYAFLYGDREFAKERWARIVKEEDGLVFTAARPRLTRINPPGGQIILKLARASKVERRMSMQFYASALGLDMRATGLTKAETQHIDFHGVPGLRLDGLLEPRLAVKPRRRIVLGDIVAAQRLLNQVVQEGRGRLEVDEDGWLKFYPIHKEE
jgi:hypothetical protein